MVYDKRVLSKNFGKSPKIDIDFLFNHDKINLQC